MKIICSLIMIICCCSIGHSLAGDTAAPAPGTPAEAKQNSRDANPLSTKTSSTTPQPTLPAGQETEPCPISLLFGGDSHQQEVLTRLRDEVLAHHEKGRTYTKLYYIHSPEITLIILTDRDIRTHAQKILADIVPVAAARLNKEDASMPQQLLDDTDSLLNEIARQASPALRDVLRMAKSEIIKKQIFEELKIRIIQ